MTGMAFFHSNDRRGRSRYSIVYHTRSRKIPRSPPRAEARHARALAVANHAALLSPISLSYRISLSLSPPPVRPNHVLENHNNTINKNSYSDVFALPFPSPPTSSFFLLFPTSYTLFPFFTYPTFKKTSTNTHSSNSHLLTPTPPTAVILHQKSKS